MFVPDGPSRRETAILLVGTAAEHGLRDDSVHASQNGFWITDDLADILYDEDVLGADPDDGEATKTSGDRAAKNINSGTDKE